MDYERAMQLADALESGKYQQGRNSLEHNEMFCCIGVASDLACQAGVLDKKYRPVSDGTEATYYSVENPDDASCTGVTRALHKWLGLKQEFNGDILFEGDGFSTEIDSSAMMMNDDPHNRRDFKYIAQKFRENWEEL